MRADLQGILKRDETIMYDVDKLQSSKAKSVFGVESALLLLLGSFFIIAATGIFVFGFAHGDSLKSISARSFAPLTGLVIIFIAIAIAHKAIAKNLKLTSVIITDKRLFMAPPAEYVRDVGWPGPKEIADIIFAEQLFVVKGKFEGSPCLIFTSLNPLFQGSPDENSPLKKRYIPFVNVDEAFENLPVFLKDDNIQFDESPTENPRVLYNRAVTFLQKRKARLR